MDQKQENGTIQKKGLKRNTIDKYYTKNNVVDEIIKDVKKYIMINDNDLVIEPSAGNGSFINSIKKISKNHVFYDIEPEHKEVVKCDFLNFEESELKDHYEKIHIIGNPPFGRQASLAIKFIKKCCEFAQSISFILPKSFKKDSMKKHFATDYHMEFEKDLPDNSFLVNNNECNVPCVFQIWIKKNKKRKVPKIIGPNYFKFVKKEDNPDISFRRVGVNAGTISKDIDDKSSQSHYFIKFLNDKSIDDNIKSLKKIKFDFDNTVGPRSVSKPELIREFNKYIS